MNFNRYDLSVTETEYTEGIVNFSKVNQIIDLSFLLTDAMSKDMVNKEIDRVCKYVRNKLKKELLNGRK